MPLAIHALSTRRDPRCPLRLGSGVVAIPCAAAGAGPIVAPLTKISAAGVAFRLEAPVPGLVAGALLTNVELRFGECLLRGEIAVRNGRPLDGAATEFGGTFVPENQEVEAALMALLAGIGAARAG